MKHSTKLLVVIATAVSTVAFAGAGWAYWTSLGSGTASASVDTLAAPVISTPVTVTGSTVSLNWSAVAPPGGAGSVSYYVLRDNAAASVACGSSAAPIAGISCNDTGVPNGVHSYTATAKFRSWTATSAPASVTVRPTVTINQAATQADPTNSGTVNFTVVFSDSVTGFTNTDVSLTGGTAGGTKTITVTGGPTTYNVAVSGATGNGTIIATVPAGGAQDLAGNTTAASTSTDNTVTLDTTAPTASSVSTANKAGSPAGTAGRAESGDTVILTYSEAMDPASILSGWNGSSASVVVRITDGGNNSNDALTVWDANNTNQVAVGTIDLSAKGYVSGNVSFSGSTMSLSASGVVTITLGAVSDSTKVATFTNANRLVWTPSTTARDLAGNTAAPATTLQMPMATQF